MLTQEITPRASTTLSLSMRPISTPVNILVTGGSYVGKTTFIKHCCSALGTPGGSASGCSTADSSGVIVQEAMTPLPSPSQSRDSAIACFSRAAAARAAHNPPVSAELATTNVTWPETVILKPVLVPEACREVIYTFQETPGHGTTIDPASHLQSLMTYILAQREKDYKQLAGSRGLHNFKADCMKAGEALDCQVAIKEMLKEPGVPGLAAIESYRIQTKRKRVLCPDGSPVNIWPLLLSCRAEAGDATPHAGLGNITHMLSSDEVYNLLDCAWDRYTSFCSAYEDAGKQLEALLDTICRPIGTLLGGHATLTALKVDAQKTEQLLQQEMDRACREVDTVKAQLVAGEVALQEKANQLAEEKKVLAELWKVFKTFRNGIGHAQNDSNLYNKTGYQVSKFLSGREISNDLKARYPDMNW